MGFIAVFEFQHHIAADIIINKSSTRRIKGLVFTQAGGTKGLIIDFEIERITATIAVWCCHKMQVTPDFCGHSALPVDNFTADDTARWQHDINRLPYPVFDALPVLRIMQCTHLFNFLA